jgi:hypothetical protein
MNSPQPSWVMNSVYIMEKLRRMICGFQIKIHRPLVSTLTGAGVSLDVSHRGFLRFGFCAIWCSMTGFFNARNIWTSSVVAAFLFYPAFARFLNALVASDRARPCDVYVNNDFRTRSHRKHLRALLWPLICSEKLICASLVPLCWLFFAWYVSFVREI